MKIGVTGHQNIPPQALEYVRRETSKLLAAAGPELVGISSLAAGGDQIFASLVLQRGGRLEVVLPCKQYDKTFPSLKDLRSCEALLERASNVETMDFEEPSEDAYLATGYRVVDLSGLLIALWDGEPAKGKGGTADVVEYARSRATRVEVVWPKGVKRG